MTTPATEEVSEEHSAAAAPSGVPFWKRLVKAAPVLLAALAVAFWFTSTDNFRRIESSLRDAQVRLQSAPDDSAVAVVHITDDEYRNLFHGASPLDHEVLERIVLAIVAGQPRLVGVDLETSPEFRERFKSLPARSSIVWARAAVFDEAKAKLRPLGALGAGERPAARAGLATMKPEQDGVIRRYRRLFETTEGALPAFSWVVAKEFDAGAGNNARASTDELFIKYAGDREGSHRFNLTVSRLLELADGEGWLADAPIKGRVVLLGGAYHASPDTYDTPLGVIPGVDVHAQIVETELQGGGIKPASRLTLVVLAAFDALLIMLIFEFLSRRAALALSVAAIPVLSLACSLVSFGSFGLWTYFAPILLVIIVQQIYDRLLDRMKDYRKAIFSNLFRQVRGNEGPESETKSANDREKD